MLAGWRGRQITYGLQIANAKDSFRDLTPVSQAAAVQTRTNWLPVQQGQAVPLIWERNYGDTIEEE